MSITPRFIDGFSVMHLKWKSGGGGTVVHHYLDHRTGKHKRQTLSQEKMIRRYISHVPARHFKMVRYSGFLANRKRGSLLPKVYALQGPTAFCRRSSRNASDGITVGKAAWNGEKAMVADA